MCDHLHREAARELKSANTPPPPPNCDTNLVIRILRPAMSQGILVLLYLPALLFPLPYFSSISYPVIEPGLLTDEYECGS